MSRSTRTASSRLADTPVLRQVEWVAVPRALPRHGATVPPEPVPDGGAQRALLAELERLEAEARSRGHDEGLSRGLVEAERRVAAAVRAAEQRCERELAAVLQRHEEQQRAHQQRLQAVLRDLPGRLEQAFAHLEEQAVALAFGAVQRVLGAVTDRAAVLEAAIRQQLKLLDAAGPLTMRLHPADLAAVSMVARDRVAGAGAVEWVGDGSLSPGDCRIESPWGCRDAGLATQLTRLCQRWSEVVGMATATGPSTGLFGAVDEPFAGPQDGVPGAGPAQPLHKAPGDAAA